MTKSKPLIAIALFGLNLTDENVDSTIPDSLDEREAKMLLAAKLYEKGSLSLGHAADLVGYSKRTFIEFLGNYEVLVFYFSEAQLEKDILNAKNYHF